MVLRPRVRLSDSVRRSIRTFIIAFLGTAIPGALGWLNALTQWANSAGQTPLPEWQSLAFLGVSAISASLIALLNVAWNWTEDATGHGLLRKVDTK